MTPPRKSSHDTLTRYDTRKAPYPSCKPPPYKPPDVSRGLGRAESSWDFFIKATCWQHGGFSTLEWDLTWFDQPKNWNRCHDFHGIPEAGYVFWYFWWDFASQIWVVWMRFDQQMGIDGVMIPGSMEECWSIQMYTGQPGNSRWDIFIYFRSLLPSISASSNQH